MNEANLVVAYTESMNEPAIYHILEDTAVMQIVIGGSSLYLRYDGIRQGQPVIILSRNQDFSVPVPFPFHDKWVPVSPA